jgi:hypothetical protein
MPSRLGWLCLLLSGAAVASGCTAVQHHSRQTPATAPQDRLVVQGDDSGGSARSGVASFEIRNVDAGAILVSTTHRQPRVQLACPDTLTLRIRVGDGSRQLTVRQVHGQVLLRTPVNEGGRWYVLARTFGALISREKPAAVRPASFGCPG